MKGLRRFEFVAAWYDLWIGAYYDRDRRTLYILPLPCLGVKIRLDMRKGMRACEGCGWRPRIDGRDGEIHYDQIEQRYLCDGCSELADEELDEELGETEF